MNVRTRLAVVAVSCGFALAATSCGGSSGGTDAQPITDAPGPGATTGDTAARDAGRAGSSPAQRTFEVALESHGGSAVDGLARLRPAEDSQATVIAVTVSGAPKDRALIGLVHDGTCDDLGDPVYTLRNVTAGRSRSHIATSFDQLRVGGYAIALHPSPDNVDETWACGNIESDAE